jgi:basic membrane protein A and related proteins
MNHLRLRRWATLGAVLPLGLGLVACGSDKDTTDTTVAAVETTAATETTAAATTETTTAATETTAAATETTAAAAGTETTMAMAAGDAMLPTADKIANFTPSDGAKPLKCAPASGPLKAAWIYVGPINDGGWTTAHDHGREYVVAQLGDKVQATYKENVPEGPQVSQVIEDLVKDGNTFIIGTSFGFQDAFVESAAKHPDVCFEFATGYKYSANLSQMYGAGEDTDFLAGMAAGAASKTGKIGFVAPFPIPEVIREVNAYTLGARTINPAATVQVVWTNTWFDPAKERAAAESLIAAGVDAIGSGQDSPATGEAAKVKGIPWSGYDSDQSTNYPDIWLTATNYHWGPYETARIQQAINGTWTPGDYYGSLADGFVTLAPYGKLVTDETKAKIEAKRAELAAKPGSQFTGPIKDQAGAEKIAAGAMASHGDLMGMNYLVEGVIGELPKG